MSANSRIEWTDATWNPVRAVRMDGAKPGVTPAERAATLRPGWHCEHVSEGCRNCYAEGFNRRFGTMLDFVPGNLAPRGAVEAYFDETMLLAPLKWRKARRIFVGSMTDLFGRWVTDEMLDRVFAVMALCPQHTFQVLTKRPERMRAYLSAPDVVDRIGAAQRSIDPTVTCYDDVGSDAIWPLTNVWLGTSVEDQAAADARILELLATPAAKRFLSCEPLLGPVDLNRTIGGTLWIGGERGCGALHRGTGAPGCPRELHHHHDEHCQPGVDWVIVGGESGPKARPMHPDWARSLRDQCAAAGVPFFFKQWGEWRDEQEATREHMAPGAAMFDRYGAPTGDRWHPYNASDRNGGMMIRVGKARAGRLLDDVAHDGMPA
ncbi:MAG: phage Gp37/Gp68 family protein [Sphingomonadaceae bacterium]|nr:phage Gp37/Gp68 family protein [Sphingomonadaceae bacterium]